ncbi:MAG: outer membrane protein assembly factor BamC [Gammaproteobacteria bacterium]|nr:outer membrane protein assembly factor BamC [Gammaproteobacteria bacterium]
MTELRCDGVFAHPPARSQRRFLRGRLLGRVLGACAATALVAGCGWWTSEERSPYPYLNAEPGGTLEVPTDLVGVTIEDTWPIPDIDDHPLARVYPGQAPRPEIFVGREDRDAVKIQRLGERRWVVVADPPELVWPVVKQFLTDASVAIAGEDPPQGVIDGGWLDIAGSDSEDIIRSSLRTAREEADVTDGRDRVRFRVEQGIRRGSTEIHLRHENDPMLQPQDTLAEASAIPSAEESILGEFGSYYAAGVASETVSMVGRDVATESKARVERDEAGHPVLRLNVDFDRAWATVSQALSRADVDVLREDRDAALIEAMVEPAGVGVARLLRGRSQRARPVRIRITPGDDGYVVNVLSLEGAPVAVELSERVLAVLREYAA